MNNLYFFDTYALIEIVRGSQNYKPYLDCGIITTAFNLAELNYSLKKEMGKEMANEHTEKFSEFAVNVSIEDIKQAMDLKSLHRNLSIPDAIGYTIAKKHSVKFLTGDNYFKDMANTEFVKKD
ncbi:PIN domain-containing protein [Candidatus Woesearchaeota archaeon]|nr:PIN domain-containing protein [Candidatus Woesearchaeota archaeon]